jgi:hypothetical protein
VPAGPLYLGQTGTVRDCQAYDRGRARCALQVPLDTVQRTMHRPWGRRAGRRRGEARAAIVKLVTESEPSGAQAQALQSWDKRKHARGFSLAIIRAASPTAGTEGILRA